jgi:1-acyl-sn-glycerol-3-phosphate acyltransferase
LVPWLGWAFHLAGYVPVLRGDKGSGASALRRLRGYLARGLPVGLFAEGTRSRDGSLRPFKAGPFKLAIEAGVPIFPVAISGAGRAMPADTLRLRPAVIRVRILPPIPTTGLVTADVDALREQVRTRLAEAVVR